MLLWLFFCVFISDFFSSIEFNFPKVNFNILRPSYIKEKLNGIWEGVNHNKLTVTGKPSDDGPYINVDKAKSPISMMDRGGEASGSGSGPALPAGSGTGTGPGTSNVNTALSYLESWTHLSHFDLSKLDTEVSLRHINSFTTPTYDLKTCIVDYHAQLQATLHRLIYTRLVEEQANGLATNLDLDEYKKLTSTPGCTWGNVLDFLTERGVHRGIVRTINIKSTDMVNLIRCWDNIVDKPDVLSRVLSEAPVAGPADAGPASDIVNPAFTYFRAWTDLFQPRFDRIDRQITIRHLSTLVKPDRNINDCFDLYYNELYYKLTQLIIDTILQEQAQGLGANLKIEGVRKLIESRDPTQIDKTLRTVLYKSGLHICNGEYITRLLIYDMDLLKKDCYRIMSRPDVLSKVLSGEFVPGTNSHTGDMPEPPRDDPVKGKRRRSR
jgi:hypothetical protein